ncbi:hypothetical protein ACJIZ3_021500 [Penstemon smallii]|uniref:Pectinesterase inhibitor domain-containing protein n=1 Tax=Penstemon smallii TaxID=265156 RepID=A0ABD3SLL3_9LAMI
MTTTHSLISLIILILCCAINAQKHDIITKSCIHASYPNICLRTLSSYGGAATTLTDLAQASVKITLSQARDTLNFLSNLKDKSNGREQGALADCVDQMGDSVEELSKTLSALHHLRRGDDFRWQMSNAETWVSAALTNEETCVDGFKEIDGKIRSDVRRRITNVARVTSNALYIINLLDDSRGKKLISVPKY